MTDAAPAPHSSSTNREILQRRLVGLAVLMLVVFGLSLLLRNGAAPEGAAPTVVLPLNAAAPEQAPAVLGQDADRAAAPEAPRSVQAAPDKPAAVVKPTAPPPAAVIPTPKPAAAASKPKPLEKPPARPSKPVAEKLAPAKPEAASGPARWYVSVGAYKDPMAAKAIAGRATLAGFKVQVVSVLAAGGERLNRVRVGPFAQREDAESARVTLIVEGLTKSVISSEK